MMAKLNECIFQCMDVFFFIFFKNVLLKILSTSYLAYQSLFIWFTKIFHLEEKDSHNRQTYFQKKNLSSQSKRKILAAKKNSQGGKKFSQQKKNAQGKKKSQCIRKMITTKKTLTVKEKFLRKKKVSHDDKKVVRINLSK